MTTRRPLVALAFALAWPLVVRAAPAADALPVVKLLDAGKGPKKALRLTAKVGLRRSVTMSMKLGMEMTVGANKMAMPLPETRLTMDLTVTKVAPNGDIRYDFKITHPEVVGGKDVMPQVMETMTKTFKGLEGMKGHALVTSRGFTREAEIQVPQNIDPQMREFIESTKQSLHQIASPLPEEPVGVGARWETTTNVVQNRMQLKQSALNDLVALNGSTGTINLKIKQTAERQTVQQPGMPAVELTSLDSSGSGNINFDLGALVPSLANMTLSSNAKMAVAQGAQKQNMDMKMNLAVTMKGQ
jgi:hypothetical protein